MAAGGFATTLAEQRTSELVDKIRILWALSVLLVCEEGAGRSAHTPQCILNMFGSGVSWFLILVAKVLVFFFFFLPDGPQWCSKCCQFALHNRGSTADGALWPFHRAFLSGFGHDVLSNKSRARHPRMPLAASAYNPLSLRKVHTLTRAGRHSASSQDSGPGAKRQLAGKAGPVFETTVYLLAPHVKCVSIKP